MSTTPDLNGLLGENRTQAPPASQAWSLQSSLAKSLSLQVFGLVVVGLFTLCVYRRYFSPISDIPGPFAASFTRLWHIKRILNGKQNLDLISLHDKHGMSRKGEAFLSSSSSHLIKNSQTNPLSQATSSA